MIRPVKMRDVSIQLTKPQQEFLALTCKYPAFVAGFGAGKSQVMCISAIFDALHGNDSLVALYEPTYKLVRDVLAPTMQKTLDMFGINYVYKQVDKMIITQSPQCGNFMFDTLDDPNKIVGYECHTAHVDELDTLPIDKARLAWQKIIARSRQRVGEHQNRVSAYTTPEGFKFVYQQWAKNKDKVSDRYKYIQASTYSNPWLDTDYIDSLKETYPTELIDAYINGQFVNLTSGTVYRSFNRSAHRSSQGVTNKDILYVGMDFNIDHMGAAIFVKRDNAYHLVDEIVDVYNTQTVIDMLKERYSNRIIVYPDSSGKNRKTSGASESDIATIQQAKIECRYKSTNPRVKDRIMAVNKAFEANRLLVSPKCTNAINALEQQAYNKNGEPDKSQGIDHILDALGYLVAYEMPIHKPAANYAVSFV